MRLLQEVQQMQGRLQNMGFVLTYLVTTAPGPVTIPMDFVPAENFDGLDMTPDIENRVLHVTPKYLPEAEPVFEASPEFLAEEAAANEGMPTP
jgi:hypothetical protein